MRVELFVQLTEFSLSYDYSYDLLVTYVVSFRSFVYCSGLTRTCFRLTRKFYGYCYSVVQMEVTAKVEGNKKSYCIIT